MKNVIKRSFLKLRNDAENQLIGIIWYMKLLESTNGGQHKLKIYIRWIETRKNHFSAYYKIGSIKDLRHFKRDLPIARFAEQVIIRGFKGDIYKFLYFKFSKPERDVIKQTILSILRSFPIIYQFIDLL